MKKLLSIFLVLVLVLALAACNNQNNENELPDIQISDINYPILEPLEGTTTDEKLHFDESGAFSYVEYHVEGNIEPYIENNIEFPDNIFIYKVSNSDSDSATLYGYMNENFERLSHPISISPNVFSKGIARIDVENGSYFVNMFFEELDELCANFILIDNGIVQVSWENEAPDQVTILTIKDPSTYLIPVKYDTGLVSEEGKVYKYGYMTVDDFQSGNKADKSTFVIQPVFDFARPFFNGLAVVFMDGKCGYIDEDGNFAIPCIYPNAQDFKETSAFVFLGEFVKIENPQPGRSDMKMEGYYGLIDMSGQKLIDFKLRWASAFHEGWAAVYYENESNYVNTNGSGLFDENIQGSAYLEDFKDGIAVVRSYISGKSKYYDTNGNNLFNLDASNFPEFNDGLAIIKERGDSSYIDKTGTIAIDEKFLSANDFSNGYAFVIKDFGDSGFIIDKMGNKYLEDLNIDGITKFNDEGHALAYSTIDKTTSPPERIYYMIHIEGN